MKLYMHPISVTSRPVMSLVAMRKLPVELEVVDLMTGAHYQEPFVTINPNRLVPVLEDGDFRLTESATILKYLAGRFDLPEYPKDLKTRAKVDEVIDWFNTNFYRDYGYGFVYPQIFPHHKRPDPAVQAGVVAWGKERSIGWLGLLDGYWLRGGRQWLVGDAPTVADLLGVGFVTLGEAIGCDFSRWPNLQAWTQRTKGLEGWRETNQPFYDFAKMIAGQPFERF
jgi:glutathione S-transferase